MTKTIRSDYIHKDLLESTPGLLEESINNQRVWLFKELAITDDQPIILTFKSVCERPEFLDPLEGTVLKTSVHVEYPSTRYVVINKSVSEKYTEHIGFWKKLKLLFSKKSVYTKETKEDIIWD
jgi:hypothetical protein